MLVPIALNDLKGRTQGIKCYQQISYAHTVWPGRNNFVRVTWGRGV